MLMGLLDRLASIRILAVTVRRNHMLALGARTHFVCLAAKLLPWRDEVYWLLENNLVTAAPKSFHAL